MRHTSFGPHKAWAAQLIALYHGELTARERAAVEAHMAGCQQCARAYTTYQEVAGAMQKLPGLLPPEPRELPQVEQDENTLEYQQRFPQQKVAETPLSQDSEEAKSSPATSESGAPATYSYGYRRRSGKMEGATRRRKKTSSRPDRASPPEPGCL